MEIVQWAVAAVTAIFVAAIGYFQWRTAQQKAVLDLFDRRHEVFAIVRNAVSQMISSSTGFDQKQMVEFSEAVERSYFFFGDDVQNYLKQLRDDILSVREADSELAGTADATMRGDIIARRREAFNRIEKFYTSGQPLFGKYMRFSQMVPAALWAERSRRIASQIERMWSEAKGRWQSR